MSLTKRQARAIRRLLDLSDDVGDAYGEFIAGPRPADPARGQFHDYLRWVCDSYAQVPEWYRNVVPNNGAMLPGIGMNNICGRYLGGGLPTVSAPFTGGQCPGVPYRCFAVLTFSTGSACQTTAETDLGVYIGPIAGLRSEGDSQPNNPGSNWWLDTGSGPVALGRVGTAGCPNAGWSALRVQRTDGQPDNCGNPRPKLPTPSPTRPPDPGPNPPGGGQPPVFGPRGTPIFRPGPIRSPFDEPDAPCPPIDPYYPDDGGEDDPYYGPDNPPPGDPGEPGAPSPTGDGGEGDGEAPEGSELVGLKLNLVQIPINAKEYAPGVFRAACYIYMGNNAGLDQDYAGSMISDGQFIFAEKPRLTRWRVVANPGYDVLVTPYYREVE